jgi:hypothetical protein
MKTSLLTVVIALGFLATPARSQDHAAHTQTNAPAVQAFEHYEGVHAALSADKVADATPHARQLAELVQAVGGAAAKKHADALVAATTCRNRSAA